MFPNDDICNVEAARLAAQRLFRRYRAKDQKEGPSMGKAEVNRLMKATYEAINMPYNPDEEDVFSFISVFDSNEDGKIELKDIEAMAVKYLCGEEALNSLKEKGEEKPSPQLHKEEKPEPNKEVTQKKDGKVEEIEAKWESKYKQLSIQTPTETSKGSALNTVYSPTASYKPIIPTFYSPKARIPSKESSSTSIGAASNTSESSIKKGSLDELNDKGKVIFQKYKDNYLGVSEKVAGKVISETYGLFGKKNYAPTEGDVKVWMKLCDRNKDGVVDWQDYKYFIQRTYQRNKTLF